MNEKNVKYVINFYINYMFKSAYLDLLKQVAKMNFTCFSLLFCLWVLENF